MEIVQTDTDGLLLHIITEDFYQDIENDIEKWFDTEKWPENNAMRIKPMINVGKLRCIKDESNGQIISAFIGIRAKMYTYLYDDDENERRSKIKEKGVPKHKANHKYDISNQVLNNKMTGYVDFKAVDELCRF